MTYGQGPGASSVLPTLNQIYFFTAADWYSIHRTEEDPKAAN